MDYLDLVARPGQTVNKIFALLGVRLARADAKGAELELPFSEGLLQGAGMVAGGVLGLLLDEAMAHAVIARLGDMREARTVTLDLNVRYLAAARPGKDLVATARVEREGASVFFLEGEVRSGAAVAARGTATFLVKRAPKPGPPASK
jgi:uncharacterized protein (TIGR00369 family)